MIIILYEMDMKFNKYYQRKMIMLYDNRKDYITVRKIKM